MLFFTTYSRVSGRQTYFKRNHQRKESRCSTMMPGPKYLTKLKFFFGATQFIFQISDITGLFHKFTRKRKTWKLSTKQDQSFNQLKKRLLADSMLAHFDLDLDIEIPANASESGLGVVLFHCYLDESGRPTANVLKALTNTQLKWLVMIYAHSNYLCIHRTSFT